MPRSFEMLAHEREMRVALRIAADAPREAVLRQVALAEQDAVQARVVFGQSIDGTTSVGITIPT